MVMHGSYCIVIFCLKHKLTERTVATPQVGHFAHRHHGDWPSRGSQQLRQFSPEELRYNPITHQANHACAASVGMLGCWDESLVGMQDLDLEGFRWI